MKEGKSGKFDFSRYYPQSPGAKAVYEILDSESAVGLHPDMTLEQLFQGSRTRMARAITRIEFTLQEKLCDDDLIHWLMTRNLDFIMWAVDRFAGEQMHPFNEFDVLSHGRLREKSSDEVDRELSERQNFHRKKAAIAIRDMATDSQTPDEDKIRAFRGMFRFRDLIKVWFRTLALMKRRQ